MNRDIIFVAPLEFIDAHESLHYDVLESWETGEPICLN